MSERDVRALPKAHLHLHLTGSTRPSTLAELAAEQGKGLPSGLNGHPSSGMAEAARGGWWRFQRLYDAARAVVSTPEALVRVVTEAVLDSRTDGAAWVEVQADPSGYAKSLGGLIPALETILEATRAAAEATGTPTRLVVAANRTRHPLEAATLARLAVRYRDEGVVGFGLSNDERRGRPEEFTSAFRIARRGGLSALPHGGELLGAGAVRHCVETLGASRVGHGVRASEDPRVLDLLAERGVTCEVCPSSNLSLGVYQDPSEVPLRAMLSAGVGVALGADDPLLFEAGLADQYTIAREVGCSDSELAELARASIRASHAPLEEQREMLCGVDGWLSTPPATEG